MASSPPSPPAWLRAPSLSSHRDRSAAARFSSPCARSRAHSQRSLRFRSSPSSSLCRLRQCRLRSARSCTCNSRGRSQPSPGAPSRPGSTAVVPAGARSRPIAHRTTHPISTRPPRKSPTARSSVLHALQPLTPRSRKSRLPCSLPVQFKYNRILTPPGALQPALRRKENVRMLRLLLHWILSALALILTSRIIAGFEVRDMKAALVAALVIGLLNATVGLVLKIITFPISILTFGIFLLVINAIMILVASNFVRGFHVTGLIPAFWGAVVLALLGMVFKAIARDAR